MLVDMGVEAAACMGERLGAAEMFWEYSEGETRLTLKVVETESGD